MQRYAWEPWHFGYALNAGRRRRARGRRRRQRAAERSSPPRSRPALARAAQRWNVSATLLAAQLYAESGFNPFAVSPAGAQGIAQFMPGTAAAIGLRDPFDAERAIDAQAHLMRDLLRRFAAVPLALAAYNAGPGAGRGVRVRPAERARRAATSRASSASWAAPARAGRGLVVRLVR